VVHYAFKLSCDIAAAWERKVRKIVRQPKWVRWQPPDAGCLVLNSDGSVRELGMAAADKRGQPLALPSTLI
ncbi:putative nucleic acid binding protein, partial [Corchorus olitorius]